MSAPMPNARGNAIREWAVQYENNVLLVSQHVHLRPTTTTQELVDTGAALGGNYEMKPLSECSMAFLRPLKSLSTRYPSERGECSVLKCLSSALKKRFAKGEGTGMPGLILADVFAAEKLAAEVMRRSGSVEPSSGHHQLSLPAGNTSWLSRLRIMEEDKPAWPTRDQFATDEQYDEALGLAEQEWWEAWVNEIEKAWGCYIHDAIPIHLCEPILRQDEGKQRFLDYDGHDGSNFNRGTRYVDDYKGPMDWKVDFTFYLLVLSQMCAGNHDLGMRLMTDEVKGRLEKKKGGSMAWVTLVDLKKIVRKTARELDHGSAEE